MTKKNDGLVTRAIRWLYWRSASWVTDPDYTIAVEDAYQRGQAEAVELPELPESTADVDAPPSPADRNGLINLFHDAIKAYVFKTDEDAYKNMLEALSAVYQTAGYLDGMACLSGVPLDYRGELREKSEFCGKKRSLEAHDAGCKGCEIGEMLRREIYPTN